MHYCKLELIAYAATFVSDHKIGLSEKVEEVKCCSRHWHLLTTSLRGELLSEQTKAHYPPLPYFVF